MQILAPFSFTAKICLLYTFNFILEIYVFLWKNKENCEMFVTSNSKMEDTLPTGEGVSEEDVFVILVATDIHLGFEENDAIRRK